MFDFDNAKRLFNEMCKKEEEYKEYGYKEYSILHPNFHQLSPNQKLKKGLSFLFLPISIALFVCVVNSFTLSMDMLLMLGVIVALCTIPSLVYLFRYKKDKLYIDKIERKKKQLSLDFEEIKKQFKKELSCLEEECKNKIFFSDVCDKLYVPLNRNVEGRVDEERKIRIVTKSIKFYINKYGVYYSSPENHLYLGRYAEYIEKFKCFEFRENNFNDLPHYFYGYAFAKAMINEIKSRYELQAQQNPIDFKNLKIYTDMGWEGKMPLYLETDITTSFLCKNRSLIDVESFDILCVIEITYDGEEYVDTRERW